MTEQTEPMVSDLADNPGAGPPRLSDCLDPETVSRVLRERLALPEPWRLVDVSVARFWAHKRGRFTVEYLLGLISTDQQRRTVALQGRHQHPIAAKDRTLYARDTGDVTVSAVGLMGVGLLLEELSMVLHSPDRDRRMPWLERAIDPVRMTDVLRGSQAADIIIGDVSMVTDIVGYRAGRRCTLRCRAEGTVFAKTFRHNRAAKIARAHNDLSDYFRDFADGHVACPRCLDVIDDYNMVIFEARDDPTSPSGANDTVPERAAKVLSVLHDASMGHDDSHTPEDELAILRRWSATFDALDLPDTADFRRGLTRVHALAGDLPPSAYSLVHRDFHGGQLLADGPSVALVDLDTIARGHVEVDLATYIAHLLLPDGQPLAAANFAHTSRRFLQDYEDHGGCYDHRRLQFYLASALFRLGAIQLFRRPRDHGTTALWAAGTLVVDGRDHATDWLDDFTKNA